MDKPVKMIKYSFIGRDKSYGEKENYQKIEAGWSVGASVVGNFTMNKIVFTWWLWIKSLRNWGEVSYINILENNYKR